MQIKKLAQKLSVSQIKKMLELKKGEEKVKPLLRKRARLQAEIEKIDGQMKSLLVVNTTTELYIYAGCPVLVRLIVIKILDVLKAYLYIRVIKPRRQTYA